MKFFIRTAQMKDSECITQLSDQLGYKTTNDKIKKRLTEISASADNCVFVACDGDIPVGWIHAFYTLRVESDPFVEIGGLVVNKDYRKMGIGKTLIDKVIDWTESKGISNLRVRSNTIRKETHVFYQNVGFKELKDQKIFGLDLLQR